jgi:hypothetical protein
MASLSGNVTFSTGLIATGTTQALALVIPVNSFYNEFDSVLAASSGCVLPVAPVLGQGYRFRNNGDTSVNALGVNLQIFPPANAQISGTAAINLPYQISVGACCELLAINALTWHVVSYTPPQFNLNYAISDQAGVSPLSLSSQVSGNYTIAVQSVGALVSNIPVVRIILDYDISSKILVRKHRLLQLLH